MWCGGGNGWPPARPKPYTGSGHLWPSGRDAQVRLHGVGQFNVRGLAKVTSVMLLVAVAHNFLRWEALMG